jgi:2-pyrone-4,6-dicarboxylate lactonase
MVPAESYIVSPSKPRLRLPAGACDAHFHVFGPQSRFPFDAGRSYTPACDAPKEALFALHAHLGIERGVVVQSAAHGLDNTAAADLIAARPQAYRGVALVAVNAKMTHLKQLKRQGFCGARFHFMNHMASGVAIEDIVDFAGLLADIGWHLQIHLESTLIAQMAATLKRSPVPVVIDHMGRVDASKGLDDPGFSSLLALMEDRNFWVKVSGSERASRQGSPWKDAVPFARKLVAEFGDRALWGTDWPHPNLKEVPDDGVLTDLLGEIAPAAAQLQALLVDNPRRFYGFA